MATAMANLVAKIPEDLYRMVRSRLVLRGESMAHFAAVAIVAEAKRQKLLDEDFEPRKVSRAPTPERIHDLVADYHKCYAGALMRLRDVYLKFGLAKDQVEAMAKEARIIIVNKARPKPGEFYVDPALTLRSRWVCTEERKAEICDAWRTKLHREMDEEDELELGRPRNKDGTIKTKPNFPKGKGPK